MLRLVLDLQDHLNLNAGAVGQRCQAHRGSGMGAGLAVELAQKVSGAVRHQGVLAEIRGIRLIRDITSSQSLTARA